MSSSHVQPVKPAALRPGDTVGIVAPASNIKRADLEAGGEALRRAGYRPFYFDSIVEQDLYFAGSVERRARELEEMFVRNDVRAIVCARGGYGANYLLKELDLEKIRAHPKILVGYSDITTLLTYVHDVGSFVTFHGPMAAKDWAHDDGVDLVSWRAAVSGTTPWDVGLWARESVDWSTATQRASCMADAFPSWSHRWVRHTKSRLQTRSCSSKISRPSPIRSTAC